jgi:hypothetical protein
MDCRTRSQNCKEPADNSVEFFDALRDFHLLLHAACERRKRSQTSVPQIAVASSGDTRRIAGRRNIF